MIMPSYSATTTAEIKPDTITAYVDGACSGNPGAGGWGVYAITNYGETYEYSGRELMTTNQRMELLAGIMALERLPDYPDINVVSDSQYLINGMNVWMPKWKQNDWTNSSKKPVANRDLWEKLDTLNQERVPTWTWVKGHSGRHGNEKANELAQRAVKKAA
jgi:ribonuclease HI